MQQQILCTRIIILYLFQDRGEIFINLFLLCFVFYFIMFKIIAKSSNRSTLTLIKFFIYLFTVSCLRLVFVLQSLFPWLYSFSLATTFSLSLSLSFLFLFCITIYESKDISITINILTNKWLKIKSSENFHDTIRIIFLSVVFMNFYVY